MNSEWWWIPQMADTRIWELKKNLTTDKSDWRIIFSVKINTVYNGHCQELTNASAIGCSGNSQRNVGKFSVKTVCVCVCVTLMCLVIILTDRTSRHTREWIGNMCVHLQLIFIFHLADSGRSVSTLHSLSQRQRICLQNKSFTLHPIGV